MGRCRMVWLVAAAGLALRLLPVLAHGDHPVLFMDSDSWGYHRLACNLLAGNGYSWDTAPPYQPNLYRPPVLPMLLAGLYRLTGPSVIAAIVLQAFVAAGTILLTYHFARLVIGDDRLALVAAGILALDPVAIQYSNLLLTEVYTSCLLILFLGTVIQFWSTRQPSWLIIGGALLALGIITHPIVLFLPLSLIAVPLSLFLAERCRVDGDRPGVRARLGHVGIGCLAAALALAPAGAWMVRNAWVGDFVGISSVTAVNLLKYKAAGVEAELHGTTREVERDRLTRAIEAELPPQASPGERYRRWQHAGTAILLAHPWTYAKVHVRGMLLELLGPERDHTTRLLYGAAVLDAHGQYNDASIAAVRQAQAHWPLELARESILFWQLVLLGLLGLGSWRLVRVRPLLLALLLSLPVYVLLLSGGPEASPRFRVLYLPLLSIVTSHGVATALRRWPSAASLTGPQPAADSWRRAG